MQVLLLPARLLPARLLPARLLPARLLPARLLPARLLPALLLPALMLGPTVANAGSPTVKDGAQPERRTNIAFAVTRQLVPLLEAKIEHTPSAKWSWAVLAAYGGDLATENFAEIGMIGLGARGSWFVLGDKRLGVGVAIDVRWELHYGVNPDIGNGNGFAQLSPRFPGDQPTVVQRLEAERTFLAAGAALFARASRRRLFAELAIGAGWQHAWTDLVQDEQTAHNSEGDWWLPWALWVGVWL